MCSERTSRRELKQEKQSVAQVLIYSLYAFSELLVFFISLGQFSDQNHLWCLLLFVENLHIVLGARWNGVKVKFLLFFFFPLNLFIFPVVYFTLRTAEDDHFQILYNNVDPVEDSP